MKTSYSALQSFKQCPQKYKFSQIDRLREPKRIESVFGTLVHSALKFMFERNPLYPTEDEVIDFFARGWGEKSAKVVWRDEEKKAEEEKMYFEEGVKIIKNFYKKNPPWNANAMELEGSFSLKILDEKTGTEHLLTGKIDRLDKDPNPETAAYEIIDYKTGKKMPTQESLATNLQLGLYGLALRSRWPDLKTTIRTSLYFLKHNEKISTEVTPKMEIQTRENILATIREIEESTEKNDFPATPSALCGWCGFRPICPMWSHEYLPEEKKNEPTEQELAAALRDFFEIKKAESEHKKQMAEIRDTILNYMEMQKVDRVFGGEGFVTRSLIPRYAFDMEKIRPVLEAIGKWDTILDPDAKKLEKLLTTLPGEIQETLLAARSKKETVMLKPGKKKRD